MLLLLMSRNSGEDRSRPKSAILVAVLGHAGLEPGFRPISKARPNWAKINDIAAKLENSPGRGKN